MTIVKDVCEHDVLQKLKTTRTEQDSPNAATRIINTSTRTTT